MTLASDRGISRILNMNPAFVKILSHIVALSAIAALNFMIIGVYVYLVLEKAYAKAPSTEEFDMGGPLVIPFIILSCLVVAAAISFMLFLITSFFKMYLDINIFIQAAAAALFIYLIAKFSGIKFLVHWESVAVEVGMLAFIFYLLYNFIFLFSKIIITKLMVIFRNFS